MKTPFNDRVEEKERICPNSFHPNGECTCDEKKTVEEKFEEWFERTEGLAVLNKLPAETRPKDVSPLRDKNKKGFLDFILQVDREARGEVLEEVRAKVEKMEFVSDNSDDNKFRHEGFTLAWLEIKAFLKLLSLPQDKQK